MHVKFLELSRAGGYVLGRILRRESISEMVQPESENEGETRHLPHARAVPESSIVAIVLRVLGVHFG